MNEKRLSFLDIAKGISITLVVVGHIVTDESNIIRTWLYSFHLPIFFIISGFLFNLTNNKSVSKQFIKKKATSLLLPYLSLAIINYFALMIIAWKENYFTAQLAIDHIIYILKLCGRSAIWFLPCIFISDLSFKIIDTNISNRFFKLAITTIIFTIPFFIKSEPDTLLLVFLRSCTAIGFITLGKYLFNIINKINPSIFQIILLFLLNITLTYLNGPVDLFQLKFNNPFYYTANSIIGSLFIIFLSKKIKENRCIQYYGKNSLIVMGTHIMLIDIHKRTLAQIFYSHSPVFYNQAYSIITLIVVMLLEIVVIYVFNNHLNFLLGKYPKKSNI